MIWTIPYQRIINASEFSLRHETSYNIQEETIKKHIVNSDNVLWFHYNNHRGLVSAESYIPIYVPLRNSLSVHDSVVIAAGAVSLHSDMNFGPCGRVPAPHGYCDWLQVPSRHPGDTTQPRVGQGGGWGVIPRLCRHK